MNSKYWVIKVIFFSIVILSIVFILNYIIDPHSINNKYDMKNQIKLKLDERKMKFNYLKEHDDYQAVILGTSKGTILDPVIVEKYTDLKTYNASFSAGTMDEFLLYTQWLVQNKNIKLLILDFEFFSLAKFSSKGTLPEELVKTRFSPVKYLGWRVLKDSIKTIRYNSDNKLKMSSIEKEYLDKGMRYEKGYFKRIKNRKLIEKHVQNIKIKKIRWHSDEIDMKKVRSLKKIKNLCNDNGIKLILLQNPSSYLHLQYDSYRYYQKLLELLKIIVNEVDEVYFFNEFNKINMDLEFFLDNFHFNYRVNEYIFKRVFEHKGIGIKLTKDNFDENYKKLEYKIK